MKNPGLRLISPRPSARALPGFLPQLLSLLLLLLAARPDAFAAGASARYVVGDLSRDDALVFEGLHAFDRNEILSALAPQLDYQLAAHPDAPVNFYLETLKKMILAGYQHRGFPQAIVSARVSNDNAHHIVVRVIEGPRSICGEIKVVGGRRFTSDPLRAGLIQKLTEPCACDDQDAGQTRTNSPARTTGQTNDPEATWLAGQPAPFDEVSRQAFATRAEKAVMDMGFFQTKLDVRVETDPTHPVANLVVEIFNDGIRGKVAEIEVEGCQKSTREQVLDYLHLKKDMEVPPRFLGNVRESLRDAARYRRHEVSLIPLAKPGQLKLKIELSEIDEAPALGQEFNAQTKDVLKFCHWLNQLEDHPEDLTVSFKARLGGRPWEGNLACSSSGLAVSLRNPDTNQSPVLDWTVVMADQQTALYSGAQQRKLVSTNLPAQLQMQMYAKTESQGESNNFTCGFGFNEAQDPFPPMRFKLDLEPALLIHFFGSNSVYSTADGIVTFGNLPGVKTNAWKLKLDAGTGHPLSFEFRKPDFELELSSGMGALARTRQEIARRTQAYHEVPLTDGNLVILPSAMAIFGPDLIRWSSLLHTNRSPAETILLQWLADKTDLNHILSPLNRLFGPQPDSSFVIPSTNVDSKSDNAAGEVRKLGGFLLQNCDSICPHGSWPWTVFHETAMACCGSGQYLGDEVQRTLDSPDTGPLGCLVAISFQSWLNPAASRPYFARSLAAISPTGFKKDWRVLLDEQTVLGALLANTLGEMRSVNDAEAALLVAGENPDDSAFVLQVIQLVKANPDKPMVDVLWPAVEQHWDQVFKPRLLDGYLQEFQKIEASLRRQGDITEAEAVHRELLALKKKVVARNQGGAKNPHETPGHAP